MKISNINEVNEFMAIADSCEEEVFLTSIYGDKFNLKSKLTQYVAVANLIQSDNELELFCTSKNDEKKFIEFFEKYPETLR